MAGQKAENILPPEVHKVIQTLTGCYLQHQDAVRLVVRMTKSRNLQPVVQVMMNSLNHLHAELATTLIPNLRLVVHRAEAAKSNHSKKSRQVMYSYRDF